MNRLSTPGTRPDRFELLMGLVALVAWSFVLVGSYPELSWPSALAGVTAVGLAVVVGRRILLRHRRKPQAIRR